MPSNTSLPNLETRSPRATQRAAMRFALSLHPGDVIALSGPLGSGKTCFARGIIAALASNPDQFQGSPSFALVQEYPSPLATLCHFDFYRINSPEELLAIGWYDYLSPRHICLVEWADRFPHLLPTRSLWLRFDITGPHSRRIAVASHPSTTSNLSLYPFPTPPSDKPHSPPP
ncbi:MAG: tRNA (adenosine(37)-N6)-threonylcarbamoyltransferase complex ATPase subunit type 1 TsaE [bacterium]|nr:tRNA (adenosine(37)-N6)-threonylcarbamoyltransferase complex ATPase subunit type 1 TsaE [bacterium]